MKRKRLYNLFSTVSESFKNNEALRVYLDQYMGNFIEAIGVQGQRIDFFHHFQDENSVLTRKKAFCIHKIYICVH